MMSCVSLDSTTSVCVSLLLLLLVVHCCHCCCVLRATAALTLFWSQVEPELRGPVGDALAAYASISDKQLLSNLYRVSLQKYQKVCGTHGNALAAAAPQLAVVLWTGVACKYPLRRLGLAALLCAWRGERSHQHFRLCL